MLGIDVDNNEPLDYLKNWAVSTGLTYQICTDPADVVYAQYGDGYIPYNTIIDENSVVLFTESGYDESTILKIIKEQFVNIDKTYLSPEGLVTINSWIYNPEDNNVLVKAIITSSDSVNQDSIVLADDGNSFDEESGDDIYGGQITLPNFEKEFSLDIKIEDIVQEEIKVLKNIHRFTSIGPVVFEGLSFTSDDTVFYPGVQLRPYINMKNEGQSSVAEDIRLNVTTTDTCIEYVSSSNPKLGDIAAGESASTLRYYRIKVSENCPVPREILFNIEIASGENYFWSDSFKVQVVENPTSVESEIISIPEIYTLEQNYPNPFNPSTKIRYQIPENNHVELAVYDALGKRVSNLVNEKQSAGWHEVEFNAANLASGIYYLKFSAGTFRQMRKMIYLK